MLRVMPRNRWREVFFVATTGELEEALDGDGLRTGEYVPTYAEPVGMRLNVNPPQGFSNGAPYGTSTDYDLIIAMDRDEADDLGVEAGWRVWLDEEPEMVGGRPTDAAFAKSFVVERVSPSIHYCQLGIRTARGE